MFKNYKMKIYPRTPIHVGTGEMISPGEYFIFDDMIYVINWGCIPYDELGDLRDLLIKWIEENPITWVKEVQKNSKLKDLIVKYAQYKCLVNEDVIEEIKKRWGENQSYLEISTLHRTLDRAFIPGSSN